MRCDRLLDSACVRTAARADHAVRYHVRPAQSTVLSRPGWPSRPSVRNSVSAGGQRSRLSPTRYAPAIPAIVLQVAADRRPLHQRVSDLWAAEPSPPRRPLARSGRPSVGLRAQGARALSDARDTCSTALQEVRYPAPPPGLAPPPGNPRGRDDEHRRPGRDDTVTGAACWSELAIELWWVRRSRRGGRLPRRGAMPTPSFARPKRGELMRFPITKPGTRSLVWAHRRRVTDRQEGKEW